MNFSWVETKLDIDEPCAEDGGRKLIMVVDGEIEIVVYGFGQGNAVLRVRSIARAAPEHRTWSDPSIVPQDTWEVIASAIVWAEPLTIGHLVMDTITNQ